MPRGCSVRSQPRGRTRTSGWCWNRCDFARDSTLFAIRMVVDSPPRGPHDYGHAAVRPSWWDMRINSVPLWTSLVATLAFPVGLGAQVTAPTRIEATRNPYAGD